MGIFEGVVGVGRGDGNERGIDILFFSFLNTEISLYCDRSFVHAS